MKTIYKYALEHVDEQEIETHEGFLDLCVKAQYGNAVLWLIVDPNKKKIKVKVYIIATGQSFDPKDKRYLDSVLLLEGRIVWHIFLETSEIVRVVN